MTGNDVYIRVLNLLGYYGNESIKTNKDHFLKRFPDLMNQICLDLEIPVINKLSDRVESEGTKLDALCYGTAMLLALVEGDGAKNELFTKIYNSKRAAALATIEKVIDRLPNVSYGED